LLRSPFARKIIPGEIATQERASDRFAQNCFLLLASEAIRKGNFQACLTELAPQASYQEV